MRLDRIDRISAAMQALYDREFRAIHPVLAEEAALRERIARLEQQVRDNRVTGGGNLAMQAVGAELLWQGWTARTHRQLNSDLAGVMARKLAAMERLRVAFGRRQAVELMCAAEQRAARARRAKRREEALLAIG